MKSAIIGALTGLSGFASMWAGVPHVIPSHMTIAYTSQSCPTSQKFVDAVLRKNDPSIVPISLDSRDPEECAFAIEHGLPAAYRLLPVELVCGWMQASARTRYKSLGLAGYPAFSRGDEAIPYAAAVDIIRTVSD